MGKTMVRAAKTGIVAGMLAGVCLPALAQESLADTPQPGGIEDIVVTAERRATNLQDTPIAITALSAEALASQGVAVINDLAATVPNLTSTTGAQGSADANFFIRGVGQFDFIITNDPGVGVYVDGVYLGRTVGAMLDSGDIGRVEVLRGPQGTLFGRNTLGGAISITSKTPEAGAFGADVRATYGSRDRIEVDGSVNVPLGGENALRAYGFYREQDGFARNALTGDRFGATDRHGGKLQLRLAPSETVTVDLSADYSLDKSNPAPSVLRAITAAPFFPATAANDIQNRNDFYTVYASNSPRARNEVYGFSGTITAELGSATLKSITAYRNLDGFSTSDPDGTRFRLYDQAVTTQQEQFSQEIQVSGDALNDRLNYLVGGYFFRERAEQSLGLCFAPITDTPTAPFNNCNTWTQQNNQLTKSYAVFGQARYKLVDTVSVTVGGRYTWDDKTIVSNQFFDFRPAGVGFGAIAGFGLPATLLGQRVAIPIVTDLPAAQKFEKFTPKLGVEFTPNSDLLIFASYSKGFRSGGFNGRLIAPQATVPSYAPDTNDAYELGFKTDLLDRALRVNGTLFYSKYKDIQQTISDPAVQFRVANAGNAELYGFELEVTAVPTEGLRFDIALGYTHSEFQDVPALVGPINGNQLPFSPEWTVGLGAEYQADLGSLGTLTPRVDFRYQARTYFTAFNLPLEQQAGYGILNGRLTWKDADRRFSASVYGLNLTDKEYYTFGQDALTSQGVAYTYLGRPREFGITLGYSF
ncbi:TonB-dependent receptor [Sphingobium algorifonticola]|uniref:TonB-dependent receptor n=1 Tax=Sphingobium algorifonticola TaxID=2008318 RepID=A0A437J9U1_9SPHN|nr:TonB-dependent receptor [Sphingobium algorifonticola]RVT42279.1 TonB-dependent receptor [Sphingobium algorifonticola]